MTSEEPEDSESDAKSEASDISEEEEDSDYNLKNDSDSNIKDDDIQQAVKVIDEIFPSSSEDNGESDDNSHEEIGKLSVCRSDVDFESSIIQEAFTKVKPLMMTETKNVAPPDTRMINNIENVVWSDTIVSVVSWL